jgi:hypothetical protein
MKIQKELVLLTLALSSLAVGAQTTVTTTGGTTNTIPVFTGTSTVGNSVITQSGGNVGIGTTQPLSPLGVTGQLVIGSPYRGDASLHITQSYGGFGRLTQISPSGSSQNALNIMSSNDSNGNGQWFAWGVDAGVWTINPGTGFGGPGFSVNGAGNVGIGTTSPSQLLEVNGNAQVDGSLQLGGSGIQVTSGGIVFPNGGGTQTAAWTGVICGGDFAESVDVTGNRVNYDPGDVLVIDPTAPGKFLKSAGPYSTSVAGIYSTKPGTVGRRQTTPKNSDEIPMAMIGIVPTKVSAENGAIRPGDLLVTSSTLGVAMKGTDRSKMLGAVIGKALGGIDSGTGTIEVLVTLQ